MTMTSFTNDDNTGNLNENKEEGETITTTITPSSVNLTIQCNRCGTTEGYLMAAYKDNKQCYLCTKCLFREEFNRETQTAIMDILIDDIEDSTTEYKGVYFDINDKNKQPTI